MLWLSKFGSWNRFILFKSPWLGHLKVYFHTKETQILYYLSYSFLGLKGEKSSSGYFLNFLNSVHTQITISIQMSIVTRIPRFFCWPKPTAITPGVWTNLPVQLFSDHSHIVSRIPSPGVRNTSYFTATFSFWMMHKQFIFGCWIYTLPLKTNYS